MPTKIAVVTGASGGIGSEVCKQIALQGVHLVLVDRKVQSSQALAAELDRLHPGVVQDAFAVDLSSHADIQRLTVGDPGETPADRLPLQQRGRPDGDPAILRPRQRAALRGQHAGAAPTDRRAAARPPKRGRGLRREHHRRPGESGQGA